MPIHNPAIVIDNGTGYTKLGYAGSSSPQHILATAIAVREPPSSTTNKTGPLDDLCFETGSYDHLSNFSPTHKFLSPIRNGVIQNWDAMERLWHRSLYSHLRCTPSQHPVLLIEQPMSDSDGSSSSHYSQRERTAEVFFETFNVPGLHFGSSPVLSLAAAQHNYGVLVEAGEGAPTIITPIAEGRVIGEGVVRLSLGGRDVTAYLRRLLKERGALPSLMPGMSGNGKACVVDHSWDIARQIKERFGYVCPDVRKEVEKYAVRPHAYIKKMTAHGWECNIGEERFMVGEVFFDPSVIATGAFKQQMTRRGLPELVDEAIQNCPIDVRRKLYGAIVLSGGSTTMKDFEKRLQRDVKRLVDERAKRNQDSLSDQLKSTQNATAVEVKVISHAAQNYAAWLGGSNLASSNGADSFAKTLCLPKQKYDEEGLRALSFFRFKD
eukprot:CAMPEP_0172489136 /NCGR_PEP_ID=MMETSP1066-20121228/18950_1 /TAXON_ID=671091 /ORGANISM="Coscinodiscus wailesii, Strain CCMP2513" /LENGTH=436 /DNA_ID=CAMNT_0013256783 /DNA_START=91 /DNA_END=1401 /DNA_ORIENTATION=-